MLELYFLKPVICESRSPRQLFGLMMKGSGGLIHFSLCWLSWEVHPVSVRGLTRSSASSVFRHPFDTEDDPCVTCQLPYWE
jgi:hypothetical protein